MKSYLFYSRSHFNRLWANVVHSSDEVETLTYRFRTVYPNPEPLT